MVDHYSGHLEITYQQKRATGGLITMPFIIANEALEKVASYGLVQNMIFYMIKEYNVGLAKGSNILFLWSAATNFTPLVGAFVSDSFLGRFLTIGLGSLSSLMGTVLLWLTAMIPEARPPHCDIMAGQSCTSATAGQMTMLLGSFALISAGAGGVRPCSIAFGADQLYVEEDPRNKRVMERFFGWYYASAAISVLVAFTGVVYVQDRLGWKVGFGIPAIFMFFSAMLFFVASPLYLKYKSSQSLFTSFAQVAVAAYKNRKVPFPSGDDSYRTTKDSDISKPSDTLRFLNKACIVRDRERDIAPDGSSVSNPWSLCTVDQVEELKALIKVIPIWSTGIMLSINTSQNSFPTLQASSMNRHVTSSFQIPAASYAMFTIIALALWVILYDRVALPLASKVRGKPVRLGVKLRMGIGLFLSFLAMVVSATVESIRRRRAISEGLSNNAHALVNMSAMWLVPQYCLHGLAEAFFAIGQTEFYYSEFPKSMSSIAASMYGLGMAVANLLASLIWSTVHKTTARGGEGSWISDNINKGHYDRYYWLLAIMSVINLPYFLMCSWLYGPCKQQVASSKHEEEEPEQQEGLPIEVQIRSLIQTGDGKGEGDEGSSATKG